MSPPQENNDKKLQDVLARMKKKNEELKKRHLEVEADKKRAADNKALVNKTAPLSSSPMPAERAAIRTPNKSPIVEAARTYNDNRFGHERNHEHNDNHQDRYSNRRYDDRNRRDRWDDNGPRNKTKDRHLGSKDGENFGGPRSFNKRDSWKDDKELGNNSRSWGNRKNRQDSNQNHYTNSQDTGCVTKEEVKEQPRGAEMSTTAPSRGGRKPHGVWGRSTFSKNSDNLPNANSSRAQKEDTADVFDSADYEEEPFKEIEPCEPPEQQYVPFSPPLASEASENFIAPCNIDFSIPPPNYQPNSNSFAQTAPLPFYSQKAAPQYNAACAAVAEQSRVDSLNTRSPRAIRGAGYSATSMEKHNIPDQSSQDVYANFNKSQNLYQNQRFQNDQSQIFPSEAVRYQDVSLPSSAMKTEKNFTQQMHDFTDFTQSQLMVSQTEYLGNASIFPNAGLNKVMPMPFPSVPMNNLPAAAAANPAQPNQSASTFNQYSDTDSDNVYYKSPNDDVYNHAKLPAQHQGGNQFRPNLNSTQANRNAGMHTSHGAQSRSLPSGGEHPGVSARLDHSSGENRVPNFSQSANLQSGSIDAPQHNQTSQNRPGLPLQQNRPKPTSYQSQQQGIPSQHNRNSYGSPDRKYNQYPRNQNFDRPNRFLDRKPRSSDSESSEKFSKFNRDRGNQENFNPRARSFGISKNKRDTTPNRFNNRGNRNFDGGKRNFGPQYNRYQGERKNDFDRIEDFETNAQSFRLQKIGCPWGERDFDKGVEDAQSFIRNRNRPPLGNSGPSSYNRGKSDWQGNKFRVNTGNWSPKHKTYSEGLPRKMEKSPEVPSFDHFSAAACSNFPAEEKKENEDSWEDLSDEPTPAVSSKKLYSKSRRDTRRSHFDDERKSKRDSIESETTREAAMELQTSFQAGISESKPISTTENVPEAGNLPANVEVETLPVDESNLLNEALINEERKNETDKTTVEGENEAEEIVNENAVDVGADDELEVVEKQKEVENIVQIEESSVVVEEKPAQEVLVEESADVKPENELEKEISETVLEIDETPVLEAAAEKLEEDTAAQEETPVEPKSEDVEPVVKAEEVEPEPKLEPEEVEQISEATSEVNTTPEAATDSIAEVETLVQEENPVETDEQNLEKETIDITSQSEKTPEVVTPKEEENAEEMDTIAKETKTQLASPSKESSSPGKESVESTDEQMNISADVVKEDKNPSGESEKADEKSEDDGSWESDGSDEWETE